MDYPDTDEMNLAKDSRDLNEYCSTHELPFQDLEHQGMMTEFEDEYKNSNDLIINSHDKNQRNDFKIPRETIKKMDKQISTIIIENPNLLDFRETPSGLI
jgi:hypothetical protein